jgi:hypothetical protein
MFSLILLNGSIIFPEMNILSKVTEEWYSARFLKKLLRLRKNKSILNNK